MTVIVVSRCDISLELMLLLPRTQVHRKSWKKFRDLVFERLPVKAVVEIGWHVRTGIGLHVLLGFLPSKWT